MSASSNEGRGLAHGVVGSARVVAFGLSSVAPAGSVVLAETFGTGRHGITALARQLPRCLWW